MFDAFDEENKVIFTGLKGLDELIGGICYGDLVVVAGRPAVGKTSLLMQITESVSLTGSVLFFTSEMKTRELVSRLLKFHAQRIGREKSIDYLSNLKIQFDQTSIPTIDYILNTSAALHKGGNLSLIVIDRFQLIKEALDRADSVAMELKSLARELDVPVICSSGLGREVDARVSKRPILSDLRNCGDLDQYANKVLFIYREGIYFSSEENKGKSEIICSKNNSKGIGHIVAKFSGELTRFLDFNGDRTLRVVDRKPNISS
ncbi:DnaB-like helicase C-terminal domain-containing protein [Nitrosomonas marina]|uniref:Replicative DNA helicase n=1 Tax=Nitrosomonas marina TaxID=917 RepID=A0A1H8J4H6_9PROT|nr:DnaB-like helicase C-terminal domain-containing protein [Nitrosomonas marina]SEN75652.1 replicative DNA helicase [Nitrosomonas marina]